MPKVQAEGNVRKKRERFSLFVCVQYIFTYFRSVTSLQAVNFIRIRILCRRHRLRK